ncbi:DegV family protein [Nesterenkonia flava]|uniref:DegV family protein n=1 Tax=Nesterenkonia flava TaxID=469799 RepID=A0ABU1FTZ7_9MICC|nr:DegV family protein [Nesterenkonia flava]MDR5712088.1 DegV family protein [Nesterenkonia flava]
MSAQAEAEARTEAWLASVEARLEARRSAIRGPKPSRRRRRGRIAVVTDSAAALPQDDAGGVRLGRLARTVVQVPIPVMIERSHHETQIYPEASEELRRDLPLALAQGAAVRTSRPSPGRLAETYRALAKEGFAGIVSVHLSSRLSGTVDAARLAAEEVPVPVHVVDSKQAGLALGHAVIEAAITAQLGGTLAQTSEVAERTAAASTAFVTVPSLEQLRRGGRITALASLLGSLLWVKPLLELKDGELHLLERPRTWPRAVERLLAVSRTAAQQEHAAAAGQVQLGVHCFGEYQQALRLAESLQPAVSGPVPVLDLPPALGAHLGLGAMAVTVSRPASYSFPSSAAPR